MKIIKNIDNKLLSRHEIELEVESDKNKSYAEMAKIIAEEFKTDEDKIIIDSIKGSFGSEIIKVKAKVYSSKELRDQALKRKTKTKKEEKKDG
jgi:ribosomal protein S24E